MEETDRDRVGLDVRQRLELERREFAARAHALAHAEAALQRDERLSVRGAQPVQRRARLPPQVEEMFEAGSRDECSPRSPPFEQRVRRHGGSVREPRDVVRADGEPVLLARTLASHGVASLPPSKIDEESWTLEVTLPTRRSARTVRVSPLRPGLARVDGANEQVLAQLRHMFRLDEDLSPFYS